MDEFEQHRPRLLHIAYRLLGSVAEAEDVVQDAYLRWHGGRPASVRNPGAFLATIVTRLCLDVLKSARTTREQYVGQWLPEMMVEASPPEPLGTLAHELSYGFLAMLERLTPEQRSVYVLRTAFDLDYGSIAEAIGSSPASCRQLMRKARERMVGPARFGADIAQSRALATRFAHAVNAGDEAALLALLADSCRFLSDGGKVVRAARKPVLGSDRVCRMLLGLRQKYGFELSAFGDEWSGSSPLLRASSSGVRGMAALDLDGDRRVTGISLQWNPQKIRGADHTA